MIACSALAGAARQAAVTRLSGQYRLVKVGRQTPHYFQRMGVCDMPGFAEYRFRDSAWTRIDSLRASVDCPILGPPGTRVVRRDSGWYRVTAHSVELHGRGGRTVTALLTGDTLLLRAAENDPGDYFFVRRPWPGH